MANQRGNVHENTIDVLSASVAQDYLMSHPPFLLCLLLLSVQDFRSPLPDLMMRVQQFPQTSLEYLPHQLLGANSSTHHGSVVV